MNKRNKVKNHGFLKEFKSIKKKRKLNLKKYKNNITFVYLKFVFLLLIIFLMIDTEKEQKFISFFIKDLRNLSNEIIYENSYDIFEKTKLTFNNDTFLNSYLEQISILNHTYNKNYKKLKRK